MKKSIETPTHTAIECTLDLAQVGEMLYEKYLSSLEKSVGPYSQEIREKLGIAHPKWSADEKAREWADGVVDELKLHWKYRLLDRLECHISPVYENPYDLIGEWNPNPILEKVKYFAKGEDWDMAVSECIRGYKKMGDAFPIDLTSDDWLDLRLMPLDQTTAN